MSVSAVNANDDWLLGRQQAGVLTGNQEIAQNIRTRLLQWKGTWFLDLNEGSDWRVILGSLDNENRLRRTISDIALNTSGVLALLSLEITPLASRAARVRLSLRTVFPDQLVVSTELAP